MLRVPAVTDIRPSHLREGAARPYDRRPVSRSRLLSALLVLLAGVVLTACSAADQEQVAQTLERAAKATKGLGMKMTMTGTMAVDGSSQSLSSRATIAPDGKRTRIDTRIGAMSMQQYFDGSSMLMSVDSFGGANTMMPPGTRYMKFDIDKVGSSMGIDTGLSTMQSIDPRRAAAMLSEVAEVKSAGRGTLGGVPVNRYSATVDLEKMMKALSDDGDVDGLAELFADGEMFVELAIGDDDRIRGFRMKGDMGPAKVDMKAQVTAYSPDLKVEVPSQGVVDVTEAIVGATDGLQKQP